MGKEVIKPTLKLRIANVGLVVPLAIGALPFFNGCSQELSQPPQFPPTDTDRPLQGNQRAKKEVAISTPTRTPTPTSTKEVSTPTEKPAEQGWIQFKSTTLPYQISHPPDWNVQPEEDFTTEGDWKGDALENFKKGFVVIYIARESISKPSTFTLDDLKKEEVNTMAEKNYPIKDIKIASVGGQKAWRIEDAVRSDSYFIRYLFLRDGEVWRIRFRADGTSVFKKEFPNFQKMLASFTFLSSTEAEKTPSGPDWTAWNHAWNQGFNRDEKNKPTDPFLLQGYNQGLNEYYKRQRDTQTPKTTEGKIAISKKPDELFRALLATPFRQDELPQGMTARGQIAGGLDATMSALKAVGQVSIGFIFDGRKNTEGPLVLDGTISYIIFPNSSDAKVAYDVTINNLPASKRKLFSDSDYPEFLYSGELSVYEVMIISGAAVKNTVVVIKFSGRNPNLQLPKDGVIPPFIPLELPPNPRGITKAAVQHLLELKR